MKLTDIIAELDDDGDIEVVAGAVVKSILADHQDIAGELLWPAVRDAVRRRRRQAARRGEDRAFAVISPEDSAETPEPAADPLAALRVLRNISFWVPGDGLVAWAEATAAQHEARAECLRVRQVAPLLADIGRHELAAGVIREAGAERLSGVPGY